eukprot:9019934-Heterocapsa_arctica.AAC.1
MGERGRTTIYLHREMVKGILVMTAAVTATPYRIPLLPFLTPRRTRGGPTHKSIAAEERVCLLNRYGPTRDR